MYTSNDDLKEMMDDLRIDIIRHVRKVVKEEIDNHFSDTNDERYYSVEEAGKLMGLSNGTIYNRIRSGQLKSKKSGRKHIISKTEIQNSLNFYSN